MESCNYAETEYIKRASEFMNGKRSVKMQSVCFRRSFLSAKCQYPEDILFYNHYEGTKMEQKRIVFIDYLRIFACFLVMLVHSSEPYYAPPASVQAEGIVSYLTTPAARFCVAFYDGFCARSCVPLFMIVSAFLLVPLKPGVTMHQFYRKRFKHILPPFVCFLLLYTFVPAILGDCSWSDAAAAAKILPFNFPMSGGHLWFMYPLISLYLIIPVISPWLERATAKEELTFIGLFVISSFAPWIKFFITPEVWGECFWNQFSMFWYCSGFLGYLVMAHYIRKHLAWERKKRFITGLVCFLIGSAVTMGGFMWKGELQTLIETPLLEWAWLYCIPNLILSSFGMFLMFTCIEKTEAPRFITKISKLTFGMYLIHIFFLGPISGAIMNGDPANPALPVAIAIPVTAVLTFIASLTAVKLISLIPGSKWVIGE